MQAVDIAQRLPASMVFFVFGAIYAATASYGPLPSVDPATNALSAHAWSKTASPYVPDYRDVVDASTPGEVTWFVGAAGGPVAQYPPGAALLGVPLDLLADADLIFDSDLSYIGEPEIAIPRPVSWPSSLTAALVSAAALAVLYRCLEEYGVSPAMSLASVVTIGFGSAVWTVAADALWQHGPAILMIAVGMLGATRGRWGLLSLAGFGAALIRPPVIILIVAIGIGMQVQRRDRTLALAASAGSLAGLVALSFYNLVVFERFGVSGGYERFIVDNVTAPDIPALVRTAWDVAFSIDRGVFIYSPFVAVALVGVPLVWSRAPASARIAFLGAILYGIVQYVAVQATPFQYTGGTGFSYYRYPIEPLFASVPLGAIGFERLAQSNFHWIRWLALMSIAFACFVHMLAATGLK